MRKKILAEMAALGYTWERADGAVGCFSCGLQQEPSGCTRHPAHVAIQDETSTLNWCGRFMRVDEPSRSFHWTKLDHEYPQE